MLLGHEMTAPQRSELQLNFPVKQVQIMQPLLRTDPAGTMEVNRVP